MATVTKGKTFISGETVEPADMHQLVDSATVTNIVDADISASAAIALSKLATGALPAAITTTTANIVDASVTQSKLASGVAGTGPAFRAYAGTATAITGQIAAQKVTLNTEDFDTANCFASSRFTPNVAGYYQFNYAVRANPPAIALQANLSKNGTTASVGSLHSASAEDSFVSAGSDLIYMNGTTDYVELFAYHNGAGSKNITASAEATFLSGFLAIKA